MPRIPTENFLLSAMLPAAIVMPLAVTSLLFYHPAAGLLIFFSPIIVSFTSVLTFGAREARYPDLLVVSLVAVVFYLLILIGALFILFMAVGDPHLGPLVWYVFVNPLGLIVLVYVIAYSLITSLIGNFAGFIIASIVRR
jgi:hypothetical protein